MPEHRLPADAARDRYLTVDGRRLHVREWGRDDARSALVVHGMMSHAREWDQLSSTLSERLRVVAVDQRGHGESDWADGYRVAALADDLAAVVEAFGLAPVAVVGHSLGGMAAVALAGRSPGLVRALAVVDVGPESLATPWGSEELPAMLEELAEARYATPDEALQLWLDDDPLCDPVLQAHYVEHCLAPTEDGRLRWRYDARGLAAQVRAGLVAPEELWQAVDGIQAPTLVLRGEHSDLLPEEAARELVDRLADGWLRTVRGGAHDLGVQQQAAVAAAVSDFFDET